MIYLFLLALALPGPGLLWVASFDRITSTELMATTVDCGDGLAARDLAGNCRSVNPTQGALEAMVQTVPSKPTVRLVP